MNFDFSDDQQAIKRTAKDLLAERFKPERVRELAEAGELRRRRLEGALRARLAGHLHRRGARRPGARHGRADHPDGGARLRAGAAAVPVERRGRAWCSRPPAPTSRRQRWLPGIASGEARGTVGAAEATARRSSCPTPTRADVILLLGHEGAHGRRGGATPRSSRSTRWTPTRRYGRVRARAAGEPLEGDRVPGISRVAAAVAAELTGIAQRAMEMAVEYARDRKQFGRPIGAYQAVSHRCAQMLLETEGARSASYYAAWCADAEPETLPLAASMAKAYASDAGWRVCTVGAPGARRHRLHLGARPALLPEAGQGRRDALRLGARAPRRVAELSAAARRERPPATRRSSALHRRERRQHAVVLVLARALPVHLRRCGCATTWRTVTEVSFSSRRGRSSPSQRDDARGERRDDDLVELHRVPHLHRRDDRVGVADAAAHLRQPGLAHGLERGRRGAPVGAGPERGIRSVKRQAPRSARSRRAASSSSEVAVTLATTRTLNSQAMAAPLLVAFATSLPQSAPQVARRESSAGPARGPGSARAARSRARAARAGAISRSPSTRAGWSGGRPAIRFRIRLRSWSAKWGVEAPISWRTSSTVGSRSARSARSNSLMPRGHLGGRLTGAFDCTGISSVIASISRLLRRPRSRVSSPRIQARL